MRAKTFWHNKSLERLNVPNKSQNIIFGVTGCNFFLKSADFENMQVILWMAQSVNGIIARKNNEEDFLSRQNWIEWVKFLKKHRCVIWGRKTHEVVKTWGKKYFDDIKGIRKVVVSKNKNHSVGEDFALVSSPKEALRLLAEEGFKTAVLTGGSNLNTSFVKENLIDEVILNIEPVMIGNGIPLFATENLDLNLELLSYRKLNKKLLQLHYKVLKGE